MRVLALGLCGIFLSACNGDSEGRQDGASASAWSSGATQDITSTGDDDTTTSPTSGTDPTTGTTTTDSTSSSTTDTTGDTTDDTADDTTDDTTSTTGPMPLDADFCEQGGQIVFEAEHFASNAGYAEVLRPDASEGAVMQVGDAGSLDFKLFFATEGEVYVWLRTYVPPNDSENNGLHLDLDGQPLIAPQNHPYSGSDDIFLHKIGWSWAPEWQGPESGQIQGPVTFMVTPGDHTLSIRKRLIERPEIDKIVLEFAGSEPGGLGPAETPCP